jgi:adenylate kinase family enzyme
MSAADRLFISLLGPPNSGKSTLSDTLCARLGAKVIRPRDAIRQTITMQSYVADLFAPVDDLGWASDYALAYAVRVTIDALSPAMQKVILENLPWDALQLMDLQHLISQTSSELVVLLIDAPDEVLMQRGGRRRVCQTCELDPMREPRRPALPAVDDAGRCGICGSRLTVRPDDTPAVLTRRIERSRGYLAQITRYAYSARVPIHRLDGAQPTDEVARSAFAILNQLCKLGLPAGNRQFRRDPFGVNVEGESA